MLRIFWKWAWLVGLSACLAGGLTVALMLRRGAFPQYSANAIVAVGVDAAEDPLLLEQVQDLIPTYIHMVSLDPITAAVIQRLGLPDDPQELGERIDARLIGDTQLLEIRVAYSDPETAAAIANEVVRQLIAQASPRTRRLIVPVQAAQPPDLPDLAGALPAVVALIAGASLAIGGVYLVEFFRHPLYDSRDVEEMLEVPALATLQARSGRSFRRQEQAEAVRWWALAEAAERQWGQAPDENRWLLVLPASVRSHSDHVARQLACTWTQRGKDVLLADADTARPMPAPDPPAGVADHLSFLPAGQFSIERLAAEARGKAAVIVIRAAPALDSIQTQALAACAGQVLLVVDAGRTTAAEAQETLDLLRASNVPVWGAVICQ